jgi:alpha-galactosidase
MAVTAPSEEEAMRPTKIVFIGAGSASFGAAMIGDCLLTPGLQGSTLALVDIDAERLDVMARFARRLNEALGGDLRIEQTTDRLQVLPEAEFVIASPAHDNDTCWRLDFQIPLKYGIKQVFGGNGGPGGLARSLRHIPLILGIAHDMERLCPRALLMNFTNPEGQIGLALSRYSEVSFVGLCHGIQNGFQSIARITGLPADDVEGIAAGLNHFAWFLDIRRKSTKADVYPLLRAADATYDPSYFPLSRKLLRLYGLYPHPDDQEIGESLSWAWEVCGLEGYDFDRAFQRHNGAWAWISRVAWGEEPVPSPEEAARSGVRLLEGRIPLRHSLDFAFPIIASTLDNRHAVIPAVNIRNGAQITNVPDWAVVEVPAVASADGIRGLQLGELPAGIAGLVNTVVHWQDLVVEAAVHGSRDTAMLAMLADPVVNSAEAAEKALDELLHVHARYLPQFA